MKYIAFVFLLLSLPVKAENIPPIFRHFAAISNLPAEVIYSIALTEAGRELNNKIVAWPWTLNVNKESIYFENKITFCEMFKKYIEDESNQVDVGVMQLNWRQHKNKFKSPDNACDPYANLQAGISHLIEKQNETNDLWEAVGRYHSKTKEHADIYKMKVASTLVNTVIVR